MHGPSTGAAAEIMLVGQDFRTFATYEIGRKRGSETNPSCYYANVGRRRFLDYQGFEAEKPMVRGRSTSGMPIGFSRWGANAWILTATPARRCDNIP